MKKKVIVMSTIIALLAATVQVHAETSISLDGSLNSKPMNSNTDRDAGQKNHSRIFKGIGQYPVFRQRWIKGLLVVIPMACFIQKIK